MGEEEREVTRGEETREEGSVGGGEAMGGLVAAAAGFRSSIRVIRVMPASKSRSASVSRLMGVAGRVGDVGRLVGGVGAGEEKRPAAEKLG